MLECGNCGAKLNVSLFIMLQSNGDDLNDHDLAVLSDWASDMNKTTPNLDWKRAYALIREGADLLLRRRARSRAEQVPPYDLQPDQLNYSQRCYAGDSTDHRSAGNLEMDKDQMSRPAVAAATPLR